MKLKSVIILLLFLLPHLLFASTCSSNGYTVLTVNGIFTDETGAKKNSDKLKYYFENTYNNQPLIVDFLYNQTHLAGFGDVIDYVKQGFFDQKSDYDLVEMLNDASQKVTTQKLLLVAHSQGNFYANNFYDKTASQPGGVPSQSIGVYGVATPANRVAGGGRYLTSDTDKIIAGLVGGTLARTIMSPNAHIVLQEGDDKNGHDFSGVYLKYQSDKIVSDIKSSLDKLQNNDEQESQDPCISPPELTVFHKAEGVALTSADFLINNTKNAAVYIGNGIYNTGLAIGNAFSGLFANVAEILPSGNSLTTLSPDVLEPTDNPLASSFPNSSVNQEQTSEIIGETVTIPTTEATPPYTENVTSDKIITTTESIPVSNIPKDEEPIFEFRRGNNGASISQSESQSETKSGTGSSGEEQGGQGGNNNSSAPDIIPPIITLLGNNPEVVVKGSAYTDAGIMVTDAVDSAPTFTMEGTVNINTVGVYTITYTAKDSSQNIATATRTVIVDDGAKLNSPNFVTVSGNYAYVVSSAGNSFEIIDISNPSTLVHKSSLVHNNDNIQLYSPGGVAVSGDYAYVVSYSNNLNVIDISNPLLPTIKSTLKNGDGGAQLIHPNFITISGNYAYIISYGGQNVEIVDISDPIYPAHKGSYYINSLSAPTSLFVSGNYMYLTFSVVGQSSGGLQILDISNPAQPVLKSTVNDGSGGATISNPQFVFVSGNYAYIASRGTNTLEIIDVSNPGSPIHKGKITVGVAPISVSISGNYAYVASFVGSALEVIDISDPTNPIHKGSLANGVYNSALSYPTSIFISGNLAYISSSMSKALEVVNISDPANPIHLNKILNGEFNHTDPPVIIPSAPPADTTPPVISALSISPSPAVSGYAKIGDTITLSITADSAGYTAKAISINNVSVTNFTDNGNGMYTATYTVSSGDNDVVSGTIPVSVVLTDAAGNSNIAYTTVIANKLKIDAHEPILIFANVTSATTIDATFSEDIDGKTVNSTGTEFTVSGHPVLSAHELEGVVTLTLGTAIGAGEKPDVTFQSTLFKDVAGNEAISPATVTAINDVISPPSLE